MPPIRLCTTLSTENIPLTRPPLTGDHVTRRPLPEDPAVRALIQAQGAVSRRTVLTAGVGGAALGTVPAFRAGLSGPDQLTRDDL